MASHPAAVLRPRGQTTFTRQRGAKGVPLLVRRSLDEVGSLVRRGTNSRGTHAWNSHMHYTYIIRSLSHPDERYIGMTDDMDQRLKTHNEGGCGPTPVPTLRSCG